MITQEQNVFADVRPGRLLPGIAYSGFSVHEGLVACLREEEGEQSLIVLDADKPSSPTVLLRRCSFDSGPDAPEWMPPVWNPTGTRLAFGCGGVQVVDARGRNPRRISSRRVWMPEGGRGAQGSVNLYTEKNAYITWMPDGQSLLFVTPESEAPPRVALWRVAADGSREQRLVDGLRSVQSFTVSPDGRRVALVTSDGAKGELLVVETDGGRCTAVDVGQRCDDHIYRYPKVLWGPHEDLLVLRGLRGDWSKHDAIELGRDLEAPRIRPLTDGSWEDGEMVLSPDGAYALVSGRIGSQVDERLAVLDLSTGGLQALPLEEEGFYMPVAWTQGRLFYTYSSPNHRGDLYSYDPGSHHVTRLTCSDESYTTPHVRAEEVSIPARDSSPGVPALLYRSPDFSGKLPALVFCHGGPASPVDRGWSPRPAWLASQGFAVLVPAFRASTGLGRRHMRNGFGESVGQADLDDVLAAAHWLKTESGVNGQRLGIVGRSWGGYLVLRAVTHSTDLFRCAWAGAAISDWEIQQAETEVRYYDRQLLGGFLTDRRVRELARERSPVHDVDKITAPLLVTHGREDRDVPFRQAERFVEELRRVKGPLEDALFFEDEGHSCKKRENITEEYYAIVTFLDRYLKPWDLDSNPCGGQQVY